MGNKICSGVLNSLFNTPNRFYLLWCCALQLLPPLRSCLLFTGTVCLYDLPTAPPTSLHFLPYLPVLDKSLMFPGLNNVYSLLLPSALGRRSGFLTWALRSLFAQLHPGQTPAPSAVLFTSLLNFQGHSGMLYSAGENEKLYYKPGLA